jgi:hypothetical protein
MRFIFLIIAVIFTTPAIADKRETLYGTWGTDKQCARAPVVPGSLVESEPFVINSQWLRRGVIWCKLSWFPVEDRENGFFTGANALCGEDTIQNYILSMTLANDELTILWGHSNKKGPLKLCEGSRSPSLN